MIGDLGSDTATKLLSCVNSAYIPGKVVAAGPPGQPPPRAAGGPRSPPPGAAAYVCRGFVCSRPVSSVEDFRVELGLSQLAPDGYQAV